MNKNLFKHYPKSNIGEYMVTILVSIVIVTIISFVVQFELMFRVENGVNIKELNIEYLSKFHTIEELEKLYLKNPEDHILNIRLAMLYESLGKIEKANEYYKNALRVSARANYPLYVYAMFCANNNLYATATTLAEELEGNNKKVNAYKAKIYEAIADKFSENGNHLAATKSYQIAHKYAKSIGDLGLFSTIKDKFSKEYINLADYNIQIKEIDEAISNLKNSLKIKNNPIANYKLGLIYQDFDPISAEKHMNKALSQNPYVVNPYVYNSILVKLIDETKILNQNDRYKFYNSRMSRFKKQISDVYLFKNEVIISNISVIEKKNFLKQSKYFLFMTLENSSNDDLSSLYLKSEFIVKEKKYEVEKRPISHINILPSLEKIDYYEIELPKEITIDDLGKNSDAFVKIYAKKAPKAPWVLLKIDMLNF